jgi:hypothetical protein
MNVVVRRGMRRLPLGAAVRISGSLSMDRRNFAVSPVRVGSLSESCPVEDGVDPPRTRGLQICRGLRRSHSRCDT